MLGLSVNFDINASDQFGEFGMQRMVERNLRQHLGGIDVNQDFCAVGRQRDGLTSRPVCRLPFCAPYRHIRRTAAVLTAETQIL